MGEARELNIIKYPKAVFILGHPVLVQLRILLGKSKKNDKEKLSSGFGVAKIKLTPLELVFQTTGAINPHPTPPHPTRIWLRGQIYILLA